MALAAWQASIVDEQGNVLPGAQVTVRNEDTNALANLFSDRGGASPLGNPMAADSHGFVLFFVAGGAYRITATSGSFSRTLRYVGVGRLSEKDGGRTPRTITSAGSYTVGDEDTLIIVNLSVGGTVALTLRSIADRADLDLLVIDVAETAQATVTFTPDGSEKVGGRAGTPAWTMTSSGVGMGSSLRLTPDIDIGGWAVGV